MSIYINCVNKSDMRKKKHRSKCVHKDVQFTIECVLTCLKKEFQSNGETDRKNEGYHRIGGLLPPNAYWRHGMETLSVLLAICAGHSPVNGEFFAQRPVTINVWVNNGEAGDLRCHHAHYDVIVMADIGTCPSAVASPIKHKVQLSALANHNNK